MSISTNDHELFNGQFNPQLFAAILVPAIFLLIIIVTMLVFILYRQPSNYDTYIIENQHECHDDNKSDCKFEILSRTPASYA